MIGETGTLFLVATPIGNLEDITVRARRILSEAPIIACEDTRHTGLLLSRLGIDRAGRRMVAYHDVNERRQAPVLLALLREGQDCALVSDAGTPGISDPGYRVVSAAREAGIPVVPIPGPCAAVAALSASGLPTDRFTFLGFVAPKSARRERQFGELHSEQGTCIFYVPARNLVKVLGELDRAQPDARVVVARELTKLFEEFLSGTPAGCLDVLQGRSVKGEVTLMVRVTTVASQSDDDQ